MSTPVPPSLVEAFCTGGTVGVDYTIIPRPSQVGVSPELASFNDGFPPATRTPRGAGGIPPRGLDMNGILFMSTAHIAWLAAGGGYVFNADVVTVQGGYAVGAVLRSAITPLLFFTNILAGNTNNPDSVSTGWVASIPQFFNTVATAGAHNNVALPGASDCVLDFDTTAGNADYSGFVAQRDGQRLYISNTGANLLQVLALSGLSTAANRIRNATDLALVQNQTLTIQYVSALSRWILV